LILKYSVIVLVCIRLDFVEAHYVSLYYFNQINDTSDSWSPIQHIHHYFFLYSFGCLEFNSVWNPY